MSLLPYIWDFNRPFRFMDRGFLDEMFFHQYPFSTSRDFLHEPLFAKYCDDSFKPVDQISAALNRLSINNLGCKVTVDDEKFQVNVDVQHFSPSEISVKISDNQVIVEGKHEEKRDEHGYISRQFVRKYSLPQGVLPDTVTSSLSSDGVLTISAPRVLALPSVGERIIPITQTGPVQKVTNAAADIENSDDAKPSA